MTGAALSIARLFEAPDLAGAVPRRLRFSPDGRMLAWLAPGDGWQRLELHVHDCASGETRRVGGSPETERDGAMPAAERERRERTRTTATGVTEFEWSHDSTSLLFPIAGVLHELGLAAVDATRVTPSGTRQSDFHQSPDGKRIAYVRDGRLFALDRDSSRESPLSPPSTETITYGLPDFIAQEEMHLFRGYWWSPDGTRIALLRVDTAAIPLTHRHDVDEHGVQIVAQRYAHAGGPNADVALLVVEVEGGARSEVAWRRRPDDYLARVDWTRAGDALLVQRQSREQDRLELVRVDLPGGASTVLVTETSATWVNLHDNLKPLADGSLLWSSERSGSARLYRVAPDGAVDTLTPEDAFVIRLLGVDAGELAAFWLGWHGDPTVNQMFRTTLADGATTVIAGERGWRDAEVSRDGLRLAYVLADDAAPPRLLLHEADPSPGTPPQVLANALDETHPYARWRESHPRIERGAIDAEDGQKLHYRLTLPRHGSSHPPVLLAVYGGPGAQRVRVDWPNLWHLFLARAGVAVFELDNRGSAQRGPEFEAPIHGRLGDIEVRDQLRGLDALAALGAVDVARVAVHGHSYGGYMTLKLLARAPDRFRCGIAGAPVSDWRLYDTHYTERYLGTPQRNAGGYAASSVDGELALVTTPLLLIHGMADDNVLFTHSLRIMHALQQSGRQFRLMTYPGSKHGLSERAVARHRHELMHDFLREHLF